MEGRFITLEGSEGCGKTTQGRLLVERLRARGFRVVESREPGGTPVGEEIRHLLKFHAAGQGMCPETELLLFSASRAQLVRQVIRPALASGAIVVCDRFHDSSTIYQGAARGLPPDLVRHVHRLAIGDTRPDLTLVLDMDAAAAHQRALQRVRPDDTPADRMESEPPEFYRNVCEGYRRLAKEEPERVRLIPAGGDADEIAEIIWKEVRLVVHA